MRIDPTNIQWPEEHNPEYWEAPEVTQQSGRPISHPPPQFGGSGLPPGQPTGPFGAQPPPPHVPQPVGSGIQPPRPQGMDSNMDPRQNRMEPRLVGNMDPRCSNTLPPRHGQRVMGSGDPRQVGGLQMDTTQPPVQYPPPPPGSVLPPQTSLQGQGVPPIGQQQWPQHHQPPQQPIHHSPFTAHPPNPIHSSSSSSGIPGSHPVPQPGQLTMAGVPSFPPGINSPLPIPSQPPIVWRPGNPDPMGPQSNTAGPRDETPSVGELRPLRVDPRTKYSQFKIKAKGSPSTLSPPVSSGTGSILKGKESNGPTSDQISSAGKEKTSTAQMPKLLQQPPPQQRPFDPRELFDSAASKDVPSDYQATGPFGITFGSYFTRSSEAVKSTNNNMPYGEIHMTNVTTSSTTLKDISSEEETREHANEGDSKSDEAKKTVPSYLAELDVGLGDTDLTIDSAFSSLDKKDIAGQGDSRKMEDTAKKLPSIFSLGSGTL